jgi:phosphatidylglycerol lysyltransferase
MQKARVASASHRERALALVQQHGHNVTAFQALEQGYRYHFGRAGCVAYVDTGSAWVVAGAPIAPAHEIPLLLAEFLREAGRAGRRCCLFGTERRLLDMAGDALGSFCIGELPVWDPRAWEQTLARRSSLREQLRRARAKGVRIRELSPQELKAGPTQRSIALLAERWLASRRLAPLDFLVRLELFELAEHRRCFVAERDGELLGVAGLVPVPARGGWFVEDLLREPGAPNGTGELLVDHVMRWAAEQHCNWLTLGLVPLAGGVGPVLRAARRGGRRFYDFDGVRSYRAKLEPSQWLPIYLSYPRGQSAALALLDALGAFTGDGFRRFSLRWLRHALAA